MTTFREIEIAANLYDCFFEGKDAEFLDSRAPTTQNTVLPYFGIHHGSIMDVQSSDYRAFLNYIDRSTQA